MLKRLIADIIFSLELGCSVVKGLAARLCLGSPILNRHDLQLL